MTLAICIKCGGRKVGALTPCSECRFQPEEAVDQAKSLLLSDHNMSPSELEGAAEKLKRGESIIFDEASVQELSNAMGLFKPTYFLGRRKTSWILFGVAILLGTLLGTCFVTLFKFFGA